MTTFTTDVLRAIESEQDLFVSPFRADGTTYGTLTQTWALVVDGEVYVRAANGVDSRWYRAAVTQGAGRIRVGGSFHPVSFVDAPDAPAAAIDAAYEAKYPGSSAVPVMTADGPKAATVRILPR